MQPETRAGLLDVKLAAERISEAARPHDFNSFAANWLVVAAIERQFGIIGEALVRIRDRHREVFDRVPDAPKIVGLRNLIVHGYDSIDPEVLWSIIGERLDALIRVVSEMLEEGN